MAKKQRSKKVYYYGIEFDSAIEGERYLYLRSLEEDGIISNLIPSETVSKPVYEIAPRVVLPKNSLRPKQRIQARITYTPDFEYIYRDTQVIEDVKGAYGNTRKNRAKGIAGKAIVSPAARLRHKLLLAQYPHFIFKIVTDPTEGINP
jgi:hypothetical protein